jgi:hypothetical protein
VGNFADGKEAGRDALLLNKSMGVDENTVFSGMKNLRTADNKSMLSSTNAMQTTLERIGVVKTGDFTKLGEYMEINNRLLGDQLVSLDKISADTNTSLITGLSAMGGSFEDPRVAETVASSIDSSLKNPSNDFIKAMQFDVLSRGNKDASVFDIMKMRSQGIQNKQFATGMIDSAIGSGGSESDIMLRATQMLGMQGQEELVERLIKSRMAGNEIYSDLERDGNLREDLTKRAGKVTAPLLDNTARINDSFATGGDKLARELDKTMHEIFGGGIPAAIESVLGMTTSGVKGIGTIATGIKETYEVIRDIRNFLNNSLSMGARNNSEFEELDYFPIPTIHEIN